MTRDTPRPDEPDADGRGSDPSDRDATADPAEAEVRAAEADVRAAEQRRHAAAEISLRAERNRMLSEDLRQAKRDLQQARKETKEARFELAALRNRRVIKLALAAADRARPAARIGRRFRSMARALLPGGSPATTDTLPRKPLRATPAEDAAFRSRLAGVLRSSGTTTGPLVSAIVVTRDGIEHVRRLLPALERLAYRDLEIVIVDNGSADATVAYAQGLTTRLPIRVVRNPENRSFSEANNQGAAAASGELLLLINNDVAPAADGVLGHMVERLVAEPDVVAVASRLLYPRRKGPATGALSSPVDLSLQHRGIVFVTWDGIPMARNLGRGEDPLGPAAAEARDVQAATAACLLVRRSAFDAAGGFTVGYDYGSEDVDLSLKLRAGGGRIVYEPQATFWHHESATQHLEEGGTRQVRQRANRELLADLWGPRIFREVFLDRLGGGGAWSDGPLHVGVTLTRDDPTEGWGDWYTAHEFGEALEGIGWQVSYLERAGEHWYAPDTSIDVVVSLLDAFDVRRLPDGVVTVAWVRNWTDRWLEREWFDEYDLVLASSGPSKALIDAHSVHVARMMPIATNPARFHPPGDPADTSAATEPARPASDLVYTGNQWGEERGIQAILPRLLGAGRSIALYGKGWDKIPAAASVALGPLPYDDLPAAYAAGAIVIDDTASPTLPYGAVNSRVFDALATGTLVVTDNLIGARELFDDLLPAASDPGGMFDLVERYLADPEERRRLSGVLRAVVLERHTYAHRATELRDHLAAWAGAGHLDIAIGPPDWDVAPRWGDYHFGRALQRALQRAGHPTRLRLRSAWDGVAAGRADAAIHIFGLSERRVRPGQVSVLWVISHPELVTDAMVMAHDVVFVASDSFAATLAARTGRPVTPLHQATDPERFRPLQGGPVHELLFVANSRGVRRPVVDELTPTDRDLAVFGSAWTPELLDPRHLRGERIPNEELAAYYAAAKIVLNDHWGDMAAHGFLSNRLYDAAASGAFVISDRVPGIDEEFDGGVVTFADGAQLRDLVDRYLDAPDARTEHAGRAAAAVAGRHTFGHRVEQIMGVIEPAWSARPRRILPDGAAASVDARPGSGAGPTSP